MGTKWAQPSPSPTPEASSKADFPATRRAGLESRSQRLSGRHQIEVTALPAGAVERDAWQGIVSGRRTEPTVNLRIQAALRQGGGSAGGPFLVVASDGRRWWAKTPDHVGKATVTEYVVARAGALIGAPVCANSLIRIGVDIAGWEYSPGRTLSEGIGHAMLELEAAQEGRSRLEYRRDDDNLRRHVGIYALSDWCWGGDLQWLYSLADMMTVYSHDHGWYLPPEGQDWDAASLAAEVDTPHELTDPFPGARRADVEEFAQALERVNRSDLVAMLTAVPTSWPVADDELEALGWFLERRAPQVAVRLRRLA